LVSAFLALLFPLRLVNPDHLVNLEWDPLNLWHVRKKKTFY
jgi:hypothetical protein